MKAYIFLMLFLSILCKDPRRPSKYTKQCLKEKLGKEEVKSLLSSFRKYHRSHGKANFTEFIYDRKPELKATLEKCLTQKNDRRLNKERILEKKLSLALFKNKELKKEIKQLIKNGNEEAAFEKCKTAMNQEGFCKGFVKRYTKKLAKKKNEE